MGQIIGGGAKPKRCNRNRLSQLGTPAAGEHILVSSDNSMNAAGQGNFDCYIIGDNSHPATELPLHNINDEKEALENLLREVQPNNGTDTLYVTDGDGNIVAKIDAQGVHSVGYYDKDGNEISAGADLSDIILTAYYRDGLYVSDSAGNAVFKLDKDGLEVIKIVAKEADFKSTLKNDWYNKNLATYGDSVVAVTNGDFHAPMEASGYNWGKRVGEYFTLANLYGRGIGGQGYKWTTGVGNGGSVSFINADGTLNSRNDSYNYDNYTGSVPSGTTKVRGCLSSWLRITTMFPASMKDNVDVVLVMAHNDGYDSTVCSFVANDTTDPEWAASGADYYGKIGGDYDLTTLRGGIASTLMKLQLWMPQAIIVLLSGISGQGTTGELNTDINSAGLMNIAEATREMSKLTSVPLIDTFATDGINGWNRTTYISDTIHPYTAAGRDMFARSVIGGLKTILPNY